MHHLVDSDSHPSASLFNSTRWFQALQEGYSLKVSTSPSLLHRGSREAFVFSSVSDVRGERIISLPFSDYCDPQVEDRDGWNAVVEPIMALGRPITLRLLKNRIPLLDERFEMAGRAVWHGVDLRRSEQELWSDLAPSARQNIRRAQRHNVVIRHSSQLDDIHIFHELHCRLRKSKYRMLAQPRAFFTALHTAFAADDLIHVLLAEVDGIAIAGLLLLCWDDTIYYKFNASVDQRFRPNDLLTWEAMLLGHRLGLHCLDFGRSDIDQPGLIRYKEKFASIKNEIYTLKWTPPDHVNDAGNRVSALLSDLTDLLTDPRIPDEVTRLAGDRLYRYFC